MVAVLPTNAPLARRDSYNVLGIYSKIIQKKSNFLQMFLKIPIKPIRGSETTHVCSGGLASLVGRCVQKDRSKFQGSPRGGRAIIKDKTSML